MWPSLLTEFSFKRVYGPIETVAKKCAEIGDSAGIADFNNTFGHVRWRKACKKAGIKPIYGVRLPVYPDPALKERRTAHSYMTFIARTTSGLQEIYQLVDLAHQQFYYTTRISYDQVNALTTDVAVLVGCAPQLDLIKRESFQDLGPQTPLAQRNTKLPQIACIDNYYPDFNDKEVYEPFAETGAPGCLLERKTYPMHILTEQEWFADFPNKKEALENLKILSAECNVDLPTAPMVKYIGPDNIHEWAAQGAKDKGLNIQTGKYAERYKREMDLIHSKDYVDYFLVVADVIRYAKKRMVVGPSRGSSAGSLICYLMGITEIDPLKFDLYFERFIDLNRSDMPDIDVDFQKNKRYLVLRYLEKKYGKDCVAQIGNINRMKAKSAISQFAKSLNIPISAVEELKDGIMERSGGDARANLCITDTIKDTDIGKRFIESYPAMGVVSRIEAHASHTGVHAAGIIVCNKKVSAYAGINSRDNKRIAMLDKKDAEGVGLLKIDALGLRTLDIFASVCDQIGKPYQWLYEISHDDPATYDVFNNQRYNGIFQFEGPAIKSLAKQMPVENMEDIAALTALGRPGPLNSGGANLYVKYRSGKAAVKYIHSHPIVKSATEAVYGVVVYQEQVMKIVRDLGKLSWADTSAIRKAMSKTLGVEFFNKMYVSFEKGCVENGLSPEESKDIWDHINTMGSWSFNKSHAVSYGLISYLCAYLKANYSLEFVVACLNFAKSDYSALKILRDAVENDGIEYSYIDEKISQQDWTVHNGKLYGGLKTIHGIGPKHANKIVKLRSTGQPYPAGLQKKLSAGASNFKYLYPGKELYGDYYTDPESHNLKGRVAHIKDTQQNGIYTVIGCMIKKNLRDANEACFVTERNGKYETGQTSWLNITIEDDTDAIMCKIQKKDYNQIGMAIAETGKEGKDWYMVYGKKINNWGLIFVTNIKKITR